MNKLIYIRKATVKQDGAEGLLYRHEWPTGWQDLVFSNYRAVEAFQYQLENKAGERLAQA